MAKKVVKEAQRGGKIPHTQPLVVPKPKFDELLRRTTVAPTKKVVSKK